MTAPGLTADAATMLEGPIFNSEKMRWEGFKDPDMSGFCTNSEGSPSPPRQSRCQSPSMLSGVPQDMAPQGRTANQERLTSALEPSGTGPGARGWEATAPLIPPRAGSPPPVPMEMLKGSLFPVRGGAGVG
ncbi:unnamed protein product, partial [Discosporangium mesarthrocarpum]